MSAASEAVPAAAAAAPAAAAAVAPAGDGDEAKVWHYKDDSGDDQGPFSTTEMRSWFGAHYFGDDTCVRHIKETDFVPISAGPSGGSEARRFISAESVSAAQRESIRDGGAFKLVKTAALVGVAITAAAPAAAAATAVQPEPVSAASASAGGGTKRKATDEPAVEAQATTAVSNGHAAAAADSKSASAGDDTTWLYKDDSGETQGPFPSDRMRAWFAAGHFPATTLIRCADAARASSTEFASIASHQAEWGTTPFTVPKSTAAATAAATSATATAATTTAAPATATAAAAPAATSAATATSTAGAAGSAGVRWYYLDDTLTRQGPFSVAQMKAWYKAGYISEVQVKLENEPDSAYARIANRRCNFVPGQYDEEQPAAAASGPAPTDRWYYLDNENKVQGPWTTAQMRTWYQADFLPATIRVRQIGDGPDDVYVPIGQRDCAFTKPPTAAELARTTPVAVAAAAAPAASAAAVAAATYQQRVVPQYQPAPVQYAAPSYGYQPAQYAAAAAATAAAVPVNPYAYAGAGAIGTPYGGGAGALASATGGLTPASGTFNSRTGKFEGAGRLNAREVGTAERQMGHYFDHDAWQDQMNARKQAQQAQQYKKARK